MSETCPDCGGDIDPEGYSLADDDCGWSHPDDCRTCGHPYCDQSC